VTRGLRMVSTGLPSDAELALMNLTMTGVKEWWEAGDGYITAKPVRKFVRPRANQQQRQFC